MQEVAARDGKIILYAPTPSLLAIRLRRESIVMVSRASTPDLKPCSGRKWTNLLARLPRQKARHSRSFGKIRYNPKPLLMHHRSVKRVSQSKTPSRVAAIHGDPFARSVGEYGGQVDHPTRHTCFCAALRSLASAVDRQRSAV
jgi:hypothetical protein